MPTDRPDRPRPDRPRPDRPRPPYRIAVLGDVGGHAFLLRRALQELGADPGTGTVPDDMVVVQVGDLVDKGPDSAACVTLADRALAASPGRWLQLWGNHEAQYLGGPAFWPDRLAPGTERVLRRWADSGRGRMAVALDTVELGPVLVTHGGLTYGKWKRIGGPRSPAEAVAALEAERRAHPERAFSAGEMLGIRPRHPVGVVWPSPAELLGSWEFELLPFSQVHGHATPRVWRIGMWDASLSERLTSDASWDDGCHHTRVRWPDDRQVVCVDPDYGRDEATVPLVALILNGEVVA